MSEPNHLPKANHLRFSFALLFIVVIGLCVIGVQKLLQLQTNEDLAKQREEYFARKGRKATAEKMVEDIKQNLRPRPTAHQPKTSTTVTPTERVTAEDHAVARGDTSIKDTSESNRNDVPAPIAGAVGKEKASIYGRVLLDGTPPAEKVIEPLMNDAICGKLHEEPVRTRLYVVGAENALANTFVYIKEGLPANAKYEPSGDLLLDQVGCLYEPYVSGAMVNQIIKIRNSDPTLHNVHATPTANAEFNFAQPLQGQVTEKRFPNADILVRFKCDVHPWMFAYVGIVEHPFFAVTDANGYFELNNVPDGTYSLEAVHLKAGRLMTTVSLKGGKLAKSPTLILKVPRN